MSVPLLNRRLKLETPQDVPDGAGGYDRVWLPLGELWAEMRPTSGRETLSGTVPVSRNALQIILRAAPVGSAARPRPEQRFRDGSRVFRIISVIEHDPHGHFLRCNAEEEVAA